jgi:hypothetical protein
VEKVVDLTGSERRNCVSIIFAIRYLREENCPVEVRCYIQQFVIATFLPVSFVVFVGESRGEAIGWKKEKEQAVRDDIDMAELACFYSTSVVVASGEFLSVCRAW